MDNSADPSSIFILVGLFIAILIFSVILGLLYPEWVGISKPKDPKNPDGPTDPKSNP